MRRYRWSLVGVFLWWTAFAFSQRVEQQLTAARTPADSARIIYRYLDNISTTDDYSEVIQDLQRIEYALVSIDQDTLRAFLYQKWAGVYKQMGEMELSAQYYDRSSTLFRASGHTKGLAQVLYLQSMMYLFSFNFDRSMDLCLQSLKLYDELQDREGQAKVYVQIGITYDYQELYDEALTYYHKALSLYEMLGNQKGLSNANNNIGIIHDIRGDLELALEYYTKSLRIDEQLGDVQGIAASKINIGLIYMGKDQLPIAEKSFLEALTAYTSLEDQTGIGVCHLNLASLYRSMRRYDQALVSVQKSIALSLQLSDMQQTIDGYEEMVRIYQELGDFEKAFATQTTVMNIKDSLFSARKKSEIVELQQKYESEKKEKEIEELSKQNALKELAIVEKVNQQLILFGSVGALVIVALFFFYQQQRGKKLNDQLHDINQRLAYTHQELEHKHLEITDSIQYARRIQEALLPASLLPNVTVLYQPKDIVSGDFYWCEQVGDAIVLAVVDCTGHGVPGAFMSIIGYHGLHKAVHEAGSLTASAIVDRLNAEVMNALHSTQHTNALHDGMDVALCVYKPKQKRMHFSGARNSMYLVRHGELIERRGNRKSIGEEADYPFTDHTVDVEEGDMLYLSTDGFADQFGGVSGRKYNYPRFRSLLMATASLPLAEQSTHLAQALTSWRQNEEQVDDVCVVGMRL